jgi:murein DD-endopeptidase MepM/ murein hydrolase activator NlpD
MFNKTYEEKKLQRELNKNFEEERQLEDKKRHENLIREIYKAKGVKRPSKGKRNKTADKLKDWSDIKKLEIKKGGIIGAVKDAVSTAAKVAVGITGAFVAGNVLAKISGTESGGSYTTMNVLPGEYKTGTYEAQAGRAKLGGGTYEKSLTDMSLGEVIELGKQRSALSGTRGGGSAAGKYQFMPATIAGLGPKVFGKNWQSVPFNKENQDKMAEALLKEEVASLKINGVPVSEATIYMTHLTGDGAKVKRIMDPANDDKKMKDVVPELAGSNNDKLASMTVKQYKESLQQKFSFGPLDEAMASNASASTKISSHFYRDSGEFHGAIDIPGKQGQPIFATGEGTVIYGNNDPNGFGSNWLIIDHGNGLRTTYGHMSERTVENGAKIKAGQQIGKMGNEGRSSGTHLHYQITQNGKNIDPENFSSPLLTPWQASIKGIPGIVQIASDSNKGQQVSSATTENNILKQNVNPTTVVNNSKASTELGKKSNQRILSAGLKQEYPEFMKITMAN